MQEAFCNSGFYWKWTGEWSQLDSKPSPVQVLRTPPRRPNPCAGLAVECDWSVWAGYVGGGQGEAPLRALRRPRRPLPGPHLGPRCPPAGPRQLGSMPPEPVPSMPRLSLRLRYPRLRVTRPGPDLRLRASAPACSNESRTTWRTSCLLHPPPFHLLARLWPPGPWPAAAGCIGFRKVRASATAGGNKLAALS